MDAQVWCTNITGSDCKRAVNAVIKELLINVILADDGGVVIGHLNRIQAEELRNKLTLSLDKWDKVHTGNEKETD